MFAIANAIERGAVMPPVSMTLSGVSVELLLNAYFALSSPWLWSDVIDTDAAAAAIDELYSSIVNPKVTGMIPISTILPWAAPTGTPVPDGFLVCNGAHVLKTSYPDLWTLIGDTYTTNFSNPSLFGIPDLQGRVIRGQRDGVDTAGTTGGSDAVTLTTDHIPPHNHTLKSSSGANLFSFATGGAGRNGLGITGGTNPSTVALTTNNSTGTAAPLTVTPRHMLLEYIMRAQ